MCGSDHQVMKVPSLFLSWYNPSQREDISGGSLTHQSILVGSGNQAELQVKPAIADKQSSMWPSEVIENTWISHSRSPGKCGQILDDLLKTKIVEVVKDKFQSISEPVQSWIRHGLLCFVYSLWKRKGEWELLLGSLKHTLGFKADLGRIRRSVKARTDDLRLPID